MQPIRWKSYALVAVQFACLIGIALSGPLLATHLPLLVLEVVAVALGLWALLTVRLNIQVVPVPRQGSRLVRHGPYRWIRHPMYSSLLLGSLALVLSLPTPLRWGLWFALLIDLLVKLYYEEGLLVQHFAGYREYMATSKRLIPYFY